MKKYTLLALLLATSIDVQAVPRFVTDLEHYHWVASAEMFTASAESGTSGCDRNIGEHYALTLNIDQYFYITNGVKNAENEWWYENTYGMHIRIGALHPFAEVGYSQNGDNVNYAGGVVVNLHNIRPFVELSNFGDTTRESVKFGSQFQLTKHIYAQVAYEVTSTKYADNITAGMYVQF